MTRDVVFSADDFGLTESVNEAIEIAHRRGVLTQASLMVAAPAAADAVRRAKSLPGLKVGLHLVTIEGPAALPHRDIPDLVDTDGQFPSDQLGLGVRYFFLPHVRRQLAREVRAQFAAFAATGLALHHADSHKHMHLHPTVGALMLKIGREYGLSRVRVPAEPPDIMRRLGVAQGVGARAMYAWTRLFRAQAERAGMETNDHCFGLAWSGHMTPQRVRALMESLPEGKNEIYFHPATWRGETLRRLMPDYEHEAELQALITTNAMISPRMVAEPR